MYAFSSGGYIDGEVSAKEAIFSSDLWRYRHGALAVDGGEKVIARSLSRYLVPELEKSWPEISEDLAKELKVFSASERPDIVPVSRSVSRL